jgi:hypothetical protein
MGEKLPDDRNIEQEQGNGDNKNDFSDRGIFQHGISSHRIVTTWAYKSTTKSPSVKKT